MLLQSQEQLQSQNHKSIKNMKTILSIIIVFAAVGFCQAQSQAIELDVQNIKFDMSDTTMTYDYIIRIDTTGFNETIGIKSKKFDLKKAADRDSLRNSPLVEPLLRRMGIFLSNQYPQE